MSEGRGQQEKSQKKNDGWNAFWQTLQNKGDQIWGVDYLEEEAGGIIKICPVNALEGGQSSEEWKTMTGCRCSICADVTVVPNPLCKPEF